MTARRPIPESKGIDPMKYLTASVLLSLALSVHSAPALSALAYCTPAANCAAAGQPCDNAIDHADTESLSLSPVAGASVIRVKLCTATDSVCGVSNPVQSVTIYGKIGAQTVYQKTLSSLNPNDQRDTGPYTELPPLTGLSVRCGNAGAQNSCKIVWQHCRDTLPVQTP
jgi:hypothetical protein